MNKKINLIYIASNGRSGSTLLDLLLGGHPECWTLGEFQMLPWEIKEHRQSCGCGEQVDQCQFWKPILRYHHHLLDRGEIHRFRQAHGAGKVLRWNELWALWTGTRLQDNRRRLKSIQQYGKQNIAVMEDILLQAKKVKGDQVSWLVDASKDPYRLFWLAQSGQFNLKVIHLVKDPRAFVYSMVKGRTRADTYKTGLRMAGRYLVENYVIDLVIKKTGMHVLSLETCSAYVDRSSALILRYEDLAKNPQVTMESVYSWLGVDCDSLEVNTFRTIAQHAISGNKMRYQSTPIRLDQKWKTESPTYLKVLTLLMTLPSAKRYGYL